MWQKIKGGPEHLERISELGALDLDHRDDETGEKTNLSDGKTTRENRLGDTSVSGLHAFCANTLA